MGGWAPLCKISPIPLEKSENTLRWTPSCPMDRAVWVPYPLPFTGELSCNPLRENDGGKGCQFISVGVMS